jgi:SAM-dependent methyltransferase
MAGEDRLTALLGKVLNDLGGAYSTPIVRIGEALGLYAALADAPATSDSLAERTGCAERYLREWLAAQAASGYIDYDAATGLFSLNDDQALLFADRSSPVYIVGAFDVAVSCIDNQPKVEAAFRSGAGVGWGDQAACMFCAVAKFFRPGYEANLVGTWLPALSGVVERLRDGGRIADVGCGHGWSTLIMARAFPKAEVIGFDFHGPSVEEAGRHAAAHGVSNARFATATAQDFPGEDFDLVTSFDSLHDMGDPEGAARHVHGALRPGGSWMIVEPLAGDTLADNLNPVGRLFYSASTMICVPTSLAQDGRAALGAQAGERRLREVIGAGGFETIRRSAETPFNMVLEARA